MRADNISAVVIILDSSNNLDLNALPAVEKCDVHRPTAKDVIRRMRLGRQRRLGLRTVLGKICRLRAQRNLLGAACIMRSPLRSFNQFSIAQQHQGFALRATTNDEVPTRRPLRRRSYQEACSVATDQDKMAARCNRRLRVVVRRLSDDLSRSRADPSDEESNTTCDVGHNNEVDMSCTSDDASMLEESTLRLSRQEIEEREEQDDGPEPVKLFGAIVDAETEDDSWEISRWQSTVEFCSPSAIDQSLPTDIPCLSA